MSEPQGFHSEVDGQHRALSDAHEHILVADEILAGLAGDLYGRKEITRRLLRTIGRLLDEAGTPSISAEQVPSVEHTNRELRAVLGDLDIPTDRRAFDINTEVQALVTADDFATNDLARERLRYLRDVLNSQDFE
jgi:hypothetical protein